MNLWSLSSGSGSASGRLAGSGEFAVAPRLAARLAGSLWRRCRAVWPRPGSRPTIVETTIAWLNQPAHAHGLPVKPGLAPCPGLTAATIPTLLDYGQDELAVRWADWLLSIADCGLRIADWEAADNRRSAIPDPRVCHCFAEAVPSGETALLEYKQWHTCDYLARELADQSSTLNSQPKVRGQRSEVRGQIPDLTSQISNLKSQISNPQSTIENLDGWTAKRLLDAARLQVAAAFASAAGVHAHIDPRDGRVVALLDWAKDLPLHARVADVGCGLGRYLHCLAEARPDLRLTGIDVAAPLLESLPPAIERCQGSLLRLPMEDARFDAAFTVEALEHSLLPERAVDELCRVVRPGGRVLIIDKHVAHQPLSLHEPWERWFTPEEPARWLGRHCDQVTVRPIPHGRHRRPTGLFLCWTGRRGIGNRV